MACTYLLVNSATSFPLPVISARASTPSPSRTVLSTSKQIAWAFLSASIVCWRLSGVPGAAAGVALIWRKDERKAIAWLVAGNWGVTDPKHAGLNDVVLVRCLAAEVARRRNTRGNMMSLTTLNSVVVYYAATITISLLCGQQINCRLMHFFLYTDTLWWSHLHRRMFHLWRSSSCLSGLLPRLKSSFQAFETLFDAFRATLPFTRRHPVWIGYQKISKSQRFDQQERGKPADVGWT